MSKTVYQNSPSQTAGRFIRSEEFVRFEWDTLTEHWDLWCQHLAPRDLKPVATVLNAGNKPNVMWGLAESRFDRSFQQVLQGLQKRTFRETADSFSKAEQGFVAEFEHGQDHEIEDLEEYAIVALALGQALPALANVMPANQWLNVLSILVDLSEESELVPAREPFVSQLISVELPITLARQFPEINECVSLIDGAITFSSGSLQELLDAEGVIVAGQIAEARKLLATWVRSQMLLASMNARLPEDDRLQFEWFIRQSLRMMRADRTAIFGDVDRSTWSKRLFENALSLSQDDLDHQFFAKCILPPMNSRLVVDVEAEEISALSEPSAVAILQNHWSRSANRLGILFEKTECRLEICAREVLLAGPIETQLKIGNRTATQFTNWEVSCWHQDGDLDFLEIEAAFEFGGESNYLVQRQFLFAREECFCLIADAVIPEALDRNESIKYNVEFPIAAGIEILDEVETTEIYLTKDGSIRSLVLPLAEGEWKSKDSKRWTHDSDRLQISVESPGPSFFVPLLIDLNATRSKQPRTWRKLTVAENLQACPPETAAGFRVRIGKDQWLFYRSLNQPSNRTLLGANLACEFFAGKFLTDGSFEELITID